MYKFLKIAFLGISLFTCFSAMATTSYDDFEFTLRFVCVDGEDYCRIYGY